MRIGVLNKICSDQDMLRSRYVDIIICRYRDICGRNIVVYDNNAWTRRLYTTTTPGLGGCIRQQRGHNDTLLLTTSPDDICLWYPSTISPVATGLIVEGPVSLPIKEGTKNVVRIILNTDRVSLFRHNVNADIGMCAYVLTGVLPCPNLCTWPKGNGHHNKQSQPERRANRDSGSGK